MMEKPGNSCLMEAHGVSFVWGKRKNLDDVSNTITHERPYYVHGYISASKSGGEVIRGLRGLGHTRFRTTLINDSRFEIHSNKSSPMYGGR